MVVMRPLVIFLACLILVPIKGWAGCKNFDPPKISVQIVPWQVAENHSLSQEELTPMVTRQAWLSPGHTARGVYDAALIHRENLVFQEQPAGLIGGPCLHIDNLTVELSYNNPTIFLARELAWARCVANVVRYHEQKHAAMDRVVMEEFIPVLQDDLEQWVTAHGPVEAKTRPEAETIWRDNLTSYIKGQLQRFSTERNRRQATIDNPEEYHRIARACPQN